MPQSNSASESSSASKAPASPELPVVNPTRRKAVKAGFATLGLAAFAAAISLLRSAAKQTSSQAFFQKHYRELSADDKREVIARLEAETKEKYGAKVQIADDRPIPGTKFVYAINLSVCNGNGNCVKACHEENQSRPSDAPVLHSRVGDG